MSYWILSLALIAFGFITAFSIGMPFLMIGGAMLVLGQIRHRAILFWPPLAAVIAFNVGYLAIAPLTCTATEAGAVAAPDASATASVSITVCHSLLGGTSTGTGIFNPSLEPANNAGLLLAAITFVAVGASILVRSRRQSSGTGTPRTLKPPST